jgi:hypothetical protein
VLGVKLLKLLAGRNMIFCAELVLKNIKEVFTWRLVVVYGLAYDEQKLSFIAELHSVMGEWLGPTLLGGDFNLIRTLKEKNNGIVNFQQVNAFNDFINHWDMLELKDPTRLFTWSNKQETPIMAVLDRILVNVEWDSKFPLSKVKVLPKGCSDHNPLSISFGDDLRSKEHVFRFEKWWLEVDGFGDLVRKVWDNECPLSFFSLEYVGE